MLGNKPRREEEKLNKITEAQDFDSIAHTLEHEGIIYPSDSDFLRFEDAYLDLLKAYSLCLMNLKLFRYNIRMGFLDYRTANILNLNILAPRITRWRIARHVQLVRECFMILIAQNRYNVSSDILSRFDQYCEDMEKLSSQVEKYGLIALFYGSIPGLILGALSGKISFYDINIGSFIFYFFIFYLIVYFIFFIFYGYYGSYKVFKDTKIREKEDKLFIYIGNYLGYIIERKHPFGVWDYILDPIRYILHILHFKREF